MIAALLVAFSFIPGGHGPAPKAAPTHRKPYFVASMQRLVPLDALGWNPTETATPVLDAAQTRLYTATHDGRVRCSFRGRPSWVFRTNAGVVAAPILDAETLFVAGGDGVVYALNRFTGEERWHADLNEELTTPPTLSEGRIYVMSSAQSVTALEASSGKRLWKYHRDAPGGFTIRGDARPAVANGTVYAGFADGTVAALGPADGVAKWTRQVSGVGDYLDVDSIAAIDGDPHLYVASAKAGILALDATNGESVWTYTLPAANHVMLDGAHVIVGGRSTLAALDRDSGKEAWKLDLGKDRFPTQPVISDGFVVVASDRGPLLMVDRRSGEARGAFNPGSGFSQSALAVSGSIYAISNGGALYNLGLVP
jgi:outer membrane protein assembly factor BamB